MKRLNSWNQLECYVLSFRQILCMASFSLTSLIRTLECRQDFKVQMSAYYADQCHSHWRAPGSLSFWPTRTDQKLAHEGVHAKALLTNSCLHMLLTPPQQGLWPQAAFSFLFMNFARDLNQNCHAIPWTAVTCMWHRIKRQMTMNPTESCQLKCCVVVCWFI